MVVASAAPLDSAIMALVAGRTYKQHMLGVTAGIGSAAGGVKQAGTVVTRGAAGTCSPDRACNSGIGVGAGMAGC